MCDVKDCPKGDLYRPVLTLSCKHLEAPLEGCMQLTLCAEHSKGGKLSASLLGEGGYAKLLGAFTSRGLKALPEGAPEGSKAEPEEPLPLPESPDHVELTFKPLDEGYPVPEGY